MSKHLENVNLPTSADEAAEIQRRRLQEHDAMEFGWFHIKTCLVSGVGFFTDAYDIFIINLVVSMLGFIYFQDQGNTVPPNLDLGIKVSVAVGTMIGQFLFGYLADNLGRKKMYGAELVIIIFTTIASVFAADAKRGIGVSAGLIFWRLLLGIGIGGDYPLSATITSEFATTKRRGAMIGAVFAMQGFGILGASLVAYLVLLAFRGAIIEDVLMLDHVWRICIAIGVIPALVSVYFRITIPETPRYKMEQANKLAKQSHMQQTAAANKVFHNVVEEEEAEEEHEKASWGDFIQHFSYWRNLKVLLGTSVTWFCLDVGFYGVNLNNSVLLKAIGFAGAPGQDAFTELSTNALGNVVIALMGTVPGYWFTVFFVDKWGRKPIQYMGFAMDGILFLILGVFYKAILNFSVTLFVALFTLAMFFKNFGPNATTFIVPAEAFPTRYRSTAHGISAASGKLGAIVAQVGFSQMKNIGGKNAFVDKLLIIFAIFMFIGFAFTYFIPETAGKSLEEINDEYNEYRRQQNVSKA